MVWDAEGPSDGGRQHSPRPLNCGQKSKTTPLMWSSDLGGPGPAPALTWVESHGSPALFCLCRGGRSCGVPEAWPCQRSVRARQGDGEEGETIFVYPIRTPPRGAPSLGCTTGAGVVGGGARRYPPAPHVRPDHRNSHAAKAGGDLSVRLSLHRRRCVQDPDIIVTVSQIMSLQYSPTEVSEDCLYLNVYAPAQAQQGDKLPVRWTAGRPGPPATHTLCYHGSESHNDTI